MPYRDKAKQQEKQREWVRQKRGSTVQGSTEVVTPVSPRTVGERADMDPHMRKSWDGILKMWGANPDKVRAMVNGVCEKSELGDLIRWGAYGPLYSEVQRILKL